MKSLKENYDGSDVETLATTSLVFEGAKFPDFITNKDKPATTLDEFMRDQLCLSRNERSPKEQKFSNKFKVDRLNWLTKFSQ